MGTEPLVHLPGRCQCITGKNQSVECTLTLNYGRKGRRKKKPVREEQLELMHMGMPVQTSLEPPSPIFQAKPQCWQGFNFA